MARSIETERKPRVFLTEEQAAAVVRLYGTGLSGPKIARKFDVGVDQVYSVLQRAGVKRSKTGTRNRRWSDAQEALMVSRYQAGESTTELATAFGTSMSAVLLVLKRHGVKRRKRAFGGYRLYDFTDATGRTFTMRSKWEVCAAIHLDRLGKEWDYEVEGFALSICDKRGHPCVYTPDFWIYEDGRIQVIDVKGRRTDSQDRRIEAFRAEYPEKDLVLWTENDLKSFGFTSKELRNPQLVVGNKFVRRQ